MIRSKILGQDKFNQTLIKPALNANSDMGHFSIGPGELISTIFEEILPPKHLWIRTKVNFEPCQDTPVLRKADSFSWPGKGRCSFVKLESVQILHAQKDDDIDKYWKLAKGQNTYEYRFAVAPTLFAPSDSIHLWPCGGRIGNFFDIEQLFAQVALDTQNVFVNSLSTWKKHLADGSEVVFEPPPADTQSLNSVISDGKISVRIEKNDLHFFYSSCRAEATDDLNFIDILCERKDQ